ncbi:Putative ribonuclease H protein At1g65750 [Linum perenne]
MFDKALIFHEARIGSDHRPLRLSLHGQRNNSQCPFRFDACWLSDPECDEIILKAFDQSNECEPFLKECSRDLKTWAKGRTTNQHLRAKDIKERLEDLSKEGRTSQNAQEEISLLQELDEIWRNDEIGWKQRANVKWLAEGDRNTAFFHTSVIHRRQRNKITRLQDSNGNWIQTDRELSNHANAFFKDLFTKRPNGTANFDLREMPSIVTEDMNSDITKEIKDDEIREAVFNLGANQSPGPDGFPGHFYRRFWNTIGPRFCDEIKNFFNTSTMPNNWNDTHLVLIPKIPHPSSMSEFRPISCCNFRYKVISKIMASRLKKWIPTLIPETQAAFTGGRMIQDNIIIVHEVLHSFKTNPNRRQDLCLKLDMRKAYDLVEWDCLLSLLQAQGFSEKWRSWIASCISTVKFEILFNGQPLESFNPTRGIRQGDPLSPFLFILMTNALSFLINRSVNSNILKGIKLNKRGPKLTHCLFADDTIIFGEATIQEVNNIMDTINKYGNYTGQEINNAKSAVYFSKAVSLDLQKEITDHIGCTTAKSNYLGIPTEWGNARKETFNFLLERMTKVAQTWKATTLSAAGKETLIKAVIQAIPSYVMSLFLLPKHITNKMNSKLRNFFWSGDLNKRSLHWKHGDILCSPKDQGGLGFRDFETFNLALLAKQAWRLTTLTQPLWVRLLKSRYFHKSSFLQAGKGARPSWIWASLCEARYSLDLGIVRVIGNGESTNLTKDPWIPHLPTNRLAANVGSCESVADWISNQSRTWNWYTVNAYCTKEQSEAIRKIPIGPQDLQDEWCWKFTNNGGFTVKSAYRATYNDNDNRRLLNRTLRRFNEEDWKWLWNLSLPPKIRMFLWRCIHNCLATNKNLHKRGCAPTPLCSICSTHDETTLHCLFNCPHASRTWTASLGATCGPSINQSFAEWIFSLASHTPTPNLEGIFSLCWNIWKARNAFIFRGDLPHHSIVANLATTDSNDWKINRYHRPSNHTTQNPPPRNTSCPPPITPSLEVYCDASFKGQTQQAAYGVVITNTDGQVCDGRSGTFHCSSPLVAEARAIKEAVSYASTAPLRCNVHSDCLSLVNAINGLKSSWPWECYGYLGSIMDILTSNPQVSISFIPRRLNAKADWIAKCTRTRSLPFNWRNLLDSDPWIPIQIVTALLEND